MCLRYAERSPVSIVARYAEVAVGLSMGVAVAVWRCEGGADGDTD